MDHSLNQIANQVLNDVYSGLKGPNNFSISLQQIKDSFAQKRNREIFDLYATGHFDIEPFCQTIPKLPIAKKDFSGVVGYSTNRLEYYAEIPEVLHMAGFNPVLYASAMDKAFPFKIIFGRDIFSALHERYTGSRPTIWIQDKSLWLLNPPIANIQHITLRAILENPKALNGVAGQRFVDDDPYPAPGAVIDVIRSKMVFDYIKQYRLGNPQPTLMAGDLNLNTEETK